jgi:hypothetical protein
MLSKREKQSSCSDKRKGEGGEEREEKERKILTR